MSFMNCLMWNTKLWVLVAGVDLYVSHDGVQISFMDASIHHVDCRAWYGRVIV
jgi:hypothetical protein